MFRKQLPQVSRGHPEVFLTDGGLETYLIFKQGIELELFAAFPCLNDEVAKQAINEYNKTYADVALNQGCGFLFESATWRASQDWAEKLRISPEDLTDLLKKSIKIMLPIRKYVSERNPLLPVVISGCIGPRGDGYKVGGSKMSPEEAESYHQNQIKIFAEETEADLVSAFTINYPEEAIGIVRAARNSDIPVVISFTVETDGNLPDGHTLKDAIEMVDCATNSYTSYYMINCAHPVHFSKTLDVDCEDPENIWHKRIRGLRSNSSELSHEELDRLEALDEGDPHRLGQLIAGLRKRHSSHLNIFGGCCGTNFNHVEQIAKEIAIISKQQ